jgi:hypothetical protein
MKRFPIPKGYIRAESQEFLTFQEGDDFLEWQCASCTKYRSNGYRNCRMNDGLRIAMGENYPIWFNDFVKVNPNGENPRDDVKILCKRYTQRKEQAEKLTS